jgi:D-alanyl-D-alanine carboxypeptidase
MGRGLRTVVVAIGFALPAAMGLVLVAGGPGGPSSTSPGTGAAGSPSPVATAADPAIGAEAGTGAGASPTAAAGASSAPPPTSVALPIRPYRPSTPRATGEVRRALGIELDRLALANRLPGVSVAIIFPDGSTWTGTSGAADIDAGVPVTPGTAFALASISKTFTAAAALALVEDGSLGLDDPVAPILPDLVADGRITVRMLLDHTSGLHDFYLHAPIDAELQGAPGAVWTAERSLGHVQKPYFEPGLGWHYSNTNYVLLGLVVEEVTGRSLAAVIRERFLGPLGLETLFYQGVEEPRGPLAHGYRVGTTTSDLSDGSAIVPFTSVVTSSGGAGSMAGTALDVARWARDVYGGDVFSFETRTEMLAAALANANRPNGVPYGLGVQVYPVDGAPSLGHSGRFLGFQSVVRHLPERNVTIAVLTNQSRIEPGGVLRALLPVAAPRAPTCGPCPVVD